MYLFLFNLPVEYYLSMMGKPKTWKGSGQMMANGKGHRETLWMMKRRRKMIMVAVARLDVIWQNVVGYNVRR